MNYIQVKEQKKQKSKNFKLFFHQAGVCGKWQENLKHETEWQGKLQM
jgi:hypothetical protein